MTLPTVNLRLLPPKAHYMLYFGGVAAFWPYISVFGKQLGLSESHVGYIFTVAPIAGIISMPLFGSIADRFKIKKKLFLLFNIINLIAILCFAILTTAKGNITRSVVIECGTGTSFVKHCHPTSTSQNWDSNVIRERIEEDLKLKNGPIVCQIDCHVNKTEQFNFCDALFFGNHGAPKFCTKNQSTTQSISHVSFMALLEFDKLIALEDCLLVKIGDIAEREPEEGKLLHRSLSCMPMQKLSMCQINCADLPSANAAMEVGGENNGFMSDGGFSPIFWLYAVFTIAGWIAMAVVTSVADALCFQTLGSRSDLYGQQRKWGSIGWGLFTLISGFLVDFYSDNAITKNYTPCFWIAGILLTLNFIVCWKWDVEEEERPKALGRRMIALLAEPKIFVFFFACVVVGICTGLLWNFLFWYVEDLAKERLDITMEPGKWIKLLQGLISIVQCFCGELPFFYIAGKFINKLGHVNSMAIVIGAFGIRFLLYSILVNPWWVLPIELLQGLTYGIFYTNMATYAYVVSPEGTVATVQGLVGAAFEGIGVSCGSLIGGLMYQHMSGRTTFRVFGVFSLVMCILYKCIMTTIDRRFEPVPLQQSGHDVLHNGTEMKEIDKRPT